MKAKIKEGAVIGQDMCFRAWHENLDLLFDVEEVAIDRWKLTAPGYGYAPPDYGNGAVYVNPADIIPWQLNAKPKDVTKTMPEELLRLLCVDWAEDDTKIKELCKSVMPDFNVDESEHGFRSTVECVEELVKRFQELEQEVANYEDEKQNGPV